MAVLSNRSRYGTATSEGPRPGPERLREAIVYIAERWEEIGESRRGATKLNKVLWLADHEAFRQRGESVTWSDYQRLPNGPAPVQLVPSRTALEADGAIRVDSVSVGAPTSERRFVALRNADRSLFSADDLQYLDAAIEQFRGATGTAASDLSHRVSAGWKAAEDKQVIPYESVYLDDRDLTEDELEWAQQIAAAGVSPRRAV